MEFPALAVDRSLVAAFGEPVIYRPVAGGERSIRGVFFDPYEVAEAFPLDVGSHETQVLVLREDVPEPHRNDEIEVRSRHFYVKEPRADEGQLVNLPLEEFRK